nr:protein-glutamate O-methyltransferase CheR [Chromobacterium sp. ASV5]
MPDAGYFSSDPALSDAEFAQFRQFIYQAAGIDLPSSKRALVQSRLAKRLRHLRLESYTDYWRLLNEQASGAERQRAINLLSTNETYFFREPQHFDWLRREALARSDQNRRTIRVWSAACSTGEEPYSIAMVLAEALGVDGNWQLFASDINTRVTAFARRAVYPVGRARKTPPLLWQKYFLRGRDEYEGMVRVAPELARRVSFSNLNLLHCQAFPQDNFDIVFLRNVLIYFNEETKQGVLSSLCGKLRRGGYLLIGHSESIRNLSLPLRQEEPSRYRLEAEHAGGRG